MAQKKKIITVTLASAGTRQRFVAVDSPYRFVKAATLKARETNSGDIYIGDDSVSSTVYTDILHASDHGVGVFEGDTTIKNGARDDVDLYNEWFDGASTGDKIFVTVLVKST